MTLNYDAAIGHLVLSVPLTKQALNSTARDPKIAAQKYEGTTLVLDLYANNYQNKASYLSGKALLKKGDLDVAQGQASYLMNETDDEPVKKFCAAPAK